MLSICIPRYNYDPSPLIAQLRSQLQGQVEIIVIDDASTLELPDLSCDRFIQLDKNIGRAAIRNLFLKHATYDWLLFLDNDVEIRDEHFLDRYIKEINAHQNNPVIYGGRNYAPTPPEIQQRLRWNYGQRIESKPASERKKEPYTSFQTNNFMVHRSVLTENPFDETLRNYGYEDLLFALRLQEKNIDIIHIDNPVLNIHLESNQRFLQLTEMAMRNLKTITVTHPEVATSLTKYSKAYGPLVPGFLKKFLYNRLLTGKGSILEFQLWKAAVFHSINI